MQICNLTATVLAEQNWNLRERKVIHEFVRCVRATFRERVQKIVLFGSRARGDADRESDYDFLVLFEPLLKDDKNQLSTIAGDVSLENCVCIMALAAEERDFSEDRYFYLYENICKEGIEL
ncbi:MAG: nucleotidyltransferase domain-containing protein [bacterium]